MVVDYALKAGGAWLVGFFPFAELYIALPTAMVTGLDDISAMFWVVFGNYTPILLIHFMYEYLMRYDRICVWLHKMVSDKQRQQVNQYGVWFVLLATPWIGVWAMGTLGKTLQMESRRFLIASLASLCIHAFIMVAVIRAGTTLISSN